MEVWDSGRVQVDLDALESLFCGLRPRAFSV